MSPTLRHVSMMIAEIYDALIEAGASEDKARKAAMAIADYESRFNAMDTELKLHRWMLTLLIALNLTILLKLFL